MDATFKERKNLYRRQRVDMHLPELAERRKERHSNASLKGGFLPSLIFAVLFWSIVFVSCQLAISALQPAGAAGEPSAFEQYVTSGIFQDTGEQTAFVITLEDKIKKLLQIVLPSMSLISITLVLLSLVSTVLYLFKQEYFDQVYLAKKAVQQNKVRFLNIGGGEGGKFKNPINPQFFNNNAVTEYGLIKCYLMPNLKAWAFYEAADGRMTVVDFFKKNALKCIMMFSFCILISDQTMLELFLKGASVGTYVFKKAAEVDYVRYIDNFLTTGSDYQPYYNSQDIIEKHKLQTYTAGYQVLKDMCDMNNAYQRSTDFKTTMGQKLVDFIDTEMAGTIPFEKENFIVKAEKIDYAAYNRALTQNGNTSSSFVMSTDTLFDGSSGLEGNYVRFFFTTSNTAETNDGTVLQTTDINNWSVDSKVVKWNFARGINGASDTEMGVKDGATVGITNISSYDIEVYATVGTNNTPVVLRQHFSDASSSMNWTSTSAVDVNNSKTIISGSDNIVTITPQTNTANVKPDKYSSNGALWWGVKFEPNTKGVQASQTVTDPKNTKPTSVSVTIKSIRSISINDISYQTGTTASMNNATSYSDSRSTYLNSVPEVTQSTT